MKTYFTLLISALISLTALKSYSQEYYLKLYESSRDRINTVVTSTISIDKIDGNIVYAYANPIELKRIKELGYNVELLPHPSSYTRALDMATTVDQMENWNRYPTYPVYRALMKKFEADYPNICKLDSIGTTVNGRKLYVLKISDNVDINEAEPEFFYTSTMHGDETTGYILMLRLAHYLLSNYGSDERVDNLVNNMAIYINPNANPDGTYNTGNHTVSGATRYNANGYDINRNFPDPREGSNPDGPHQPETIAMMEFAQSRNFILSANFHGGIELVNFPWDAWTSYQNKHADHNWYYTISRQYADLAHANSPSNYFRGMDDGVTHGGDWYVVAGGRQDYMNYWHNCREVTLEISNTKLLSTDLLPALWNYNKESILTYMELVFAGIKGTVTNEQGEPLAATIAIQGHDKDNSHVVTNPLHGNYYRMIEPGTWQVTYSSQGFNDQTHEITVESYNSSVTKDVVLTTGTSSALDKSQNIDIHLSPNPFNQLLTIDVNLKSPSFVNIEVYTVSGQKVATVTRTFQQNERQSYHWKPERNIGKGLYIIQVTTDQGVTSRKVLFNQN